MKKFISSSFILMLIAGMLTVSACKDDGGNTTPAVTCIGGDLTIPDGGSLSNSTYTGKNVTIDANATVSLIGAVTIPSGCTITVNEGATIKANVATLSYLAIAQGAKIQAVGTATNPIVFTSSNAAGTRNPQDWGGIVIHGKAPVNNTTGVNTALDTEIFTGPYGGEDVNDNSGTLQYVRIEFAGNTISAGAEFNGLFLAGVGKGTTIDHIQAHRGSDDGIEIFGGSVNITYTVISDNQDDQFDLDEGWKGYAQYVICAVPKDGDNAIEYDGNGADDNRATSTVFSNFTIVGSLNHAKEGAVAIKAAGGLRLYNSYIGHFWGDNGVIFLDDSSITNQSAGNVQNAFESNFVEKLYTDNTWTTAYGSNSADIIGCTANGSRAGDCTGVTALAALFPDGSSNNDVTNLDGASGAKLTAPAVDGVLWGATSGISEFIPSSSITVGTYKTGLTAPNGDTVVDATYVGAFASGETWADNWTSFPIN